MKEAHDNVCASFFTDLNKAFLCVKYDLFIAKFNAFDFDHKSLRVMHAYFNNWIQFTKVGSYFKELLDIIFGVLKGSLLGPLLFNINIIDSFW